MNENRISALLIAYASCIANVLFLTDVVITDSYKCVVISLSDINECEGTNSCNVHATCKNTVGSYTCMCTGGYRGDGYTCDGSCAWLLISQSIANLDIRLFLPYM